MSVEELADKVKRGEPGAMLELWQSVRRFVEMKAGQRSRASGGRAEVEDLTQAGFLAVIDTAQRFKPGHGWGFLHALGYALQKAFAQETGTRSTRRDLLQYADSAESAAYREDPDGPTVAETVPDSGAALAFMGVEYADFLTYCRGVINSALDTLPDAQAAVIRLHYLQGVTLEESALLCGLSSKQAASDTEQRGLCRMERGKYGRDLRDCLTAFDDFHAFGEAARWDIWSRTGISRTEAAALVKTGRESA